MEEQIQEYLYNPTVGKIVSFFYWHRSNLMLIKALKESFRKLKTTIAIRLRNSVLSLVFF
jgi:hypothetical protein